MKCEYIPIHVQRQQTAAAAAGGSPIHGMSPPSAASRSLPSTPQPWPPSASPQFIATSRHSPASYHDWPEYYDLSAELSADSRRQIQPQSAPSYLGTESLGQCQPYASRYQTYGHNVVNGPHYPVSVADAYGPSSGSDGSGVSQAVGYPMPMENTSQVISGANQGSVRSVRSFPHGACIDYSSTAPLIRLNTSRIKNTTMNPQAPRHRRGSFTWDGQI